MGSNVANSDQRPIYAVRAHAVPVRIEAFKMGVNNFRIRFARGIGWAPQRYKSEQEVLKALLSMRSYGVAEARMCKEICKQHP